MTEEQKILRFCQAKIFRDIWRITDQETALQMCFMLEDGMDTAPLSGDPQIEKGGGAASIVFRSPQTARRLRGHFTHDLKDWRAEEEEA